MKRLTVIDLFCGAGGFSEGFRQAGFQIVQGVDNWRPAIDTFNYNFGLDCVARDLLDFERSVDMIESLPDTDAIIGSPPCTSFSSSNRSGRADKSMGQRLTKAFLRVVAVKKHKADSRLRAWFMENVRNSTSHLRPRYTFRDLRLAKWAKGNGLNPDGVAIELEGNRYVVNAADYGTPQARLRVFTGEIRGTTAPVVPPRCHDQRGAASSLPPYVTLGHVIHHLPPASSSRSRRHVTDPLYGISIELEELTDHFYDTGLYTSDWEETKYLKENHPYMGLMSFPEREDRPSRTVLATKIGNSREALVLPSAWPRKGDGEYRTPTVREAASLMGFPITFQFLGSEGAKWTLVGNAVCPPVSRAFAQAVRTGLGLRRSRTLRLASSGGPRDHDCNLNSFRTKDFGALPRKRRGPRFRRHPFKQGNLTVTLSNFEIGKQRGVGKWRASIQFGIGEGFRTQQLPEGYYKELTPVIRKLKRGMHFLDAINNGFLRFIAPSKTMQEMHETREERDAYLHPARLIDTLAQIIDAHGGNKLCTGIRSTPPLKRDAIPEKQLMALYAISKIATVANRKKS